MNTFTQWCSRQEESLKAAQLPFKTHNLRNDFSLITIFKADMPYSESTLALTLIFVLKYLKRKWHFSHSVFPNHSYCSVPHGRQ